MTKPIVDWEICQACNPCEARQECKTHAIIKIDITEPAFIEPALCNSCQKCLPACSFGAIKINQFQISIK